MSVAAQSLRRPVLAAAGAAAVVAMIGVLMTDLGPWYLGLRMPAWKPPDALFGPAWTLIFATAALAGAYGWQALPGRQARLALCGYFAANAVLNVLWSALFFRLQRPDWALLEVGLLWLSVLVLMVTLWRATRRGSLLLAPYLVWVSYAALLNLAVVRLNPR
jgi:tryptophan-rich sensory protein